MANGKKSATKKTAKHENNKNAAKKDNRSTSTAKTAVPAKRRQKKPVATKSDGGVRTLKESETVVRTEKNSPAKTTMRERDPRLPPAGTVLERRFKGETFEVKVLGDSFEFRGRAYRSLSGIAKDITGSETNGFLWFGLISRAGTRKSAAMETS